MNINIVFLILSWIICNFSFVNDLKEIKSEIRKPNIILIMADDMGYECLSCYGSTSYSTPVLDELAQKGIRFTNCYSQPLCTPSRVKIMTGKYNFSNYEAFGYLNPNQKTFGNLMKEAGYETCIAGKWQLNGLSSANDLKEGWDDPSRPYHFGFDEYCLWQLSHRVNSEDGILKERYKDPFIEQNGKVLENTKGEYGPDVFCNFILDFIEQKKDTNFFIYYPMVLTHSPFQPTPDSPDWNIDLAHRESNNKYFSEMVSYTDKIVGQINRRLKELNLQNNTILIFTGDNGTDQSIISNTINGEIKGGKGTMTDSGTKVPLIISWPNKGVKGIVNDNLIGFADFYATFSNLINKNEFNDGKSFLPVLTGNKYKPRKNLIMHYNPLWGNNNQYQGRFVRDKRYKLYYDGRFYDLLSDPEEQNPQNFKNLKSSEKKVWKKLNRIHKKLPVWQ